VDSGTGSVEGVNEVVGRCAEWLRTDGWSIDRHTVGGPSPFGTLAHVGPMTRTVADTALLLDVVSGFDVRDPWLLPPPART